MERMQFISELPVGEECVSMIQFQDRIYLATKHRIYVLVDNELVPIILEERREEK